MKNIIVAVGMCLLVLVFTSSSTLAQCGGCGISNYSSSYVRANSRAPYGFIKAPAYGSSCCSVGQNYAGTGRASSSSLPPCCQTSPGAVSSTAYKGNGRGQVTNQSSLPPCCQNNPNAGPSASYKGYGRSQTTNQSSLPPCCQTGAGARPTAGYSARGPIRREIVQINYTGARSVTPKPAARQKIVQPDSANIASCCAGSGQALAKFARQTIESRPTQSLWALLDGSTERNRPTVVRQASAKPVEQSSVAKLLSWNPQWARPASAPARVASNQPTNPTNSTLPPCCAAKAQQ